MFKPSFWTIYYPLGSTSCRCFYRNWVHPNLTYKALGLATWRNCWTKILVAKTTVKKNVVRAASLDLPPYPLLQPFYCHPRALLTRHPQDSPCGIVFVWLLGQGLCQHLLCMSRVCPVWCTGDMACPRLALNVPLKTLLSIKRLFRFSTVSLCDALVKSGNLATIVSVSGLWKSLQSLPLHSAVWLFYIRHLSWWIMKLKFFFRAGK